MSRPPPAARACWECGTDISDRGPSALYCRRCVAEHKRKQTRRRARIRYRELGVEAKRALFDRFNRNARARRAVRCKVTFEPCQAAGCKGWFRQTGGRRFCLDCSWLFYAPQIKSQRRARARELRDREREAA